MTKARSGDLEAIKSILVSPTAKDMPPSVRADVLATGLFEAAAEGHLEVATLLATSGANLNLHHAKNGDTALCIAAFTGRDEIVMLLADLGADVNLPNKAGVTPLMLAAGRCSAETVRKLLEHGADSGAVASGGFTASTFAEMEGRYEVLELLRG